MIFGGILSGGIGARMLRADMPKQYLNIGDKPIILHTIDQFLQNTHIDEVFVAVPAAWLDFTKELLHNYYAEEKKLHLLAGGATRNETLMCVLDEIEKCYGLRDDDYIISHDAIRPFVTSRIIDDNIDAVKLYKAVDTVVPAYDTIVESSDGIKIDNIPLRSHMYQGQTPQSFHIRTLRNVYASLTEDEVEVLTDAAKIFVLKGQYVHLVTGDISNMKITTPHDLKVANALMLNGWK